MLDKRDPDEYAKMRIGRCQLRNPSQDCVDATCVKSGMERAAQTQHFVDNETPQTGKKHSHMKKSTKRSDFLRFYVYLCYAIDDSFACYYMQHQDK